MGKNCKNLISLTRFHWAKILTNLTFLGGTLLVIVANTHPSQAQELWIYSYLRWLLLFFLLLAAAYFLFSLRSQTLSKINKFVLVALLFNVVLVEVLFQISHALIPLELIQTLPSGLRKQVAHERGLMTEDSLMGSGMLYSHNPDKYNYERYPWVRIDKDGYRNPENPTGGVDVVIMGDSVAFANAAHFDLADKFRRHGTTAYSLAVKGYSPFHYRDAYRKYMIARRRAHKQVVVLISSDDDAQDATRYLKVESRGDYIAYLEERRVKTSFWVDHLPFFLPSIAVRAPVLIKNQFTAIRALISSAAEPDVKARFPY